MNSLAEQAEQEFDRGAERRIDPEEEDGEHRGHDENHDRGRARLLHGRPNDLAAFGANLTDEFAGRNLCHCCLDPVQARVGRTVGG